jgi:hypothetical protein
MAELHQIASDTDLYPVFTTGKKLNKKASRKACGVQKACGQEEPEDEQ